MVAGTGDRVAEVALELQAAGVAVVAVVDAGPRVEGGHGPLCETVVSRCASALRCTLYIEGGMTLRAVRSARRRRTAYGTGDDRASTAKSGDSH